MRVSNPVLKTDPLSFAAELTMTIAIPLEPIQDMNAPGYMNEQQFIQMIGEEVLNRIKNRFQH